MLKHLFKLIWNKKKQNFVLMLEILVSFLVIFAVFTMVVYYYKNYRKPLNLQYERVWAIHFEIPSRPPNRDSLLLFYENLRNQIKSMPEIEAVSITSSNVPFSMSTMQNNFNYDGKGITLNDYICEGEHARVLGAKMAAGRWFSKEDNASKYRPVVINEELKKRWFGNGDAIGKILNKESDHPYKVVGVVTDMKTKGDYQLVEPELYRRADTADYYWLSNALVRVKPTADVAFESRLYKSLPNFINHGTLEIEHLTDKLVSRNSMTLVPMIILMIVAGFFVVNVALGLFGVLWYNINRRRGEIGLRRAVGATGQSVSRQLVSEALVLATMALIVGCFFAVQFPLMNVFDMPASVYLIAIGLSVIFIYLLVAACSFYPGKQAATIYPAVALHEE
ncbi:FtsX-like permease family protein [Paraflavitalea sp. CAU 1676]|uniref:ABC transporter permease n=1 Tax=Paraflavitalea sp. CAU 1676 TaxID=3032598 RepID=UPI0023DB6BFE|nr:FtsX-like permease family protein [Paraflavitalea sp. CAU 1676]MDF2191123.1 ABC transporter permease [Paraflavitalea sp. CAU 1676]